MKLLARYRWEVRISLRFRLSSVLGWFIHEHIPRHLSDSLSSRIEENTVPVRH